MTRFVLTMCAVSLALSVLAGCGKYGPPVRVEKRAPTRAAANVDPAAPASASPGAPEEDDSEKKNDP